VLVVTRDRAGAYAEGIRLGAPHALQVADRFPLVGNVTDALERYLTRPHVALRQATLTSESVVLGADPPEDTAPASSREQPARRARRLARYEEVIARHTHAVSERVIAAHVGVSGRSNAGFTMGSSPSAADGRSVPGNWHRLRRICANDGRRGVTMPHGSGRSCARSASLAVIRVS